jgi:Ca-activated chloride channel homolog
MSPLNIILRLALCGMWALSLLSLYPLDALIAVYLAILCGVTLAVPSDIKHRSRRDTAIRLAISALWVFGAIIEWNRSGDPVVWGGATLLCCLSVLLPTEFLRALIRPINLLWVALATAAGLAIYFGIDAWIDDRATIVQDWRGRPVEFLDPRWFKLAAVIPYFFLLRLVSLTDLSVAQQWLQSLLRGAIVAALAVAMARPSWVTRDDKIATVVLIDVSDSVSDGQLAAAEKYVDELESAARGGDTLQVITFAEKPQVIRKQDGAWPIARHSAAGAGTDIQAAMQLAYGLYPPDRLSRMVIVSDGNQTEGDILAESYRAKEMKVRVAWQNFPDDKVKEIRVVGASVPDEVKTGQPFEVTAEVWSTHDDDVTLVMQQGDPKTSLDAKTLTREVRLQEGVNRVKFKTEVKHDKSATFKVRLSKYGADTEKANNEVAISTPVKGKPHVLYVEGGVLRNPGTARYMEKALEHEDIDVEVRGPRSLPSSVEELRKYDMVLVSDVPAHFMNPGQMAALDRYVRDGGGLVMAGGEDSFGSGGYQGSRIEQIMPVRFDSETTRDQPDIALMLVIDRSGSMQGAKLEAAKESARATTEVLAPNDIIGVVAFDSEAITYVKPQRASNRMRISAEISRIQAGGGTNIFPGLREAFEHLQGVNAKVKHVIVLSDGEAPYDGIVDLVNDMRSARITVSCVGVQGADRNLLSLIADNGHGRLYMVEDIGALPRLFMKETTEAKKSQLVEDLVKVRVAKRVEAIEGTGVEGAPYLHGYVTTKPKPTAEVILISDLGEPILARWRHGGGWSVAWTSDVKNRWAVDWIRWGGYPKFWGQLVRSSMKREMWKAYDMYASVDNGRAQVVIDAIDPNDKFVNELDTELEVIDPRTNQPTMTMTMEQAAAGRYVADFKIEKYGTFLLKAVHKRSGKQVAETQGSVSLSYPLEYLRTTPDVAPLEHAALVTDGWDQPEPAKLWVPDQEPVEYIEDLWPWVLFAVAGLMVLDIYAKRLRLFGYRTIRFE